MPGLTDTEKPRMRGPKRASKIRKLFNLSKEDDVRKYVNTYRRTFTTKSGMNSFGKKSLILYFTFSENAFLHSVASLRTVFGHLNVYTC